MAKVYSVIEREVLALIREGFDVGLISMILDRTEEEIWDVIDGVRRA